MTDPLSEEVLTGLEFVGVTLAPFFMEDPKLGNASAMFEAISVIDPEVAAQDWPFVVDFDTAFDCLTSMKRGASEYDKEHFIWEYRRLFVGPAARPVPPWGSVYMDRDCVVFGITEIELERWLRKNDIKRQTNDKVPEDHIGLMFAQMAYIARYRPELLREYLEQHLLTWSHHFFNQLQRATDHPFYQKLAVLADASLEGFKEQTGLSIEYPRYYR